MTNRTSEEAETNQSTIVRLEPRISKCLLCDAPFEQPVRVQGGGRPSKYCSHKCGALFWSRKNKAKVKKIKAKSRKKRLSDPVYRAKRWGQNALLRRKYPPERKLWMNARRSAKERGLEFTIQPRDIKIPLRCPLLDIELVKNGPLANRPSIDRFDSKRGYTPDNIWVISFAANTAKSNLTLDQLKTLVENFEKRTIERQIHDARG